MPTYYATVQDPETGTSKSIGIVADSFEDAEAAAIEQRLKVASWDNDQPRSGLDLLHWQNTQIIRLLEYGHQQHSEANTLLGRIYKRERKVWRVLDRMDIRFASRSIGVNLSQRSHRKLRRAIRYEVVIALVLFVILVIALWFLVVFLFGAVIMAALAGAAGTP